jgi:diguanylate cyclase (GGDEF)-like protein
MADKEQQSSSIVAILELVDRVRLGGRISRADDGSLLLHEVHLTEAPPNGKKVSIRAGMAGHLELQSGDEKQRGAALIQGINGSTLTLKLTSAQSAEACLRMLTAHQTSASATGISQGQLTGSTADHTRILGEFRQRSLNQLDEIMKKFVKSLYEYLLHQATNMNTSQDTLNPYFDGAYSLRGKGDKVCAQIRKNVDEYYLNLCPGEGEDNYWQQQGESADELGLVDLGEFENDLAIDRMVAIGEELHQRPLEALLIRVADLVGAEPTQVRLPLHARQLSRAFQGAMQQLNGSPEVMIASFDFFTKQVVRNLGDYYTALNTFLEGKGIRPGLEEQIRTHGSLLQKKHARKTRPETPPSKPEPKETLGQTLAEIARTLPPAKPGDAAPAAPAQPIPPPAPAVQDLYQTVVNALNFRREAEGLAEGQYIDSGTPMVGTWDGSTVPSTELDQSALADAQTIAQALGAIQRDSDVRQALQQASSLREYLAQHKDQMGSLRDTSGLTADSLNQLDLVDNLFGTIKSQLDVSEDLKPALTNLQIPLAKLALLDPKFFLDRHHIARSVVDKLSALATSANFPNRALEDRIGAVVDDIVNDYEHDDSVFQRALEKIDRLAEQQERALSRNIERVVRIQEGQEKLLTARRAVNEVINQRIRPPAAPRVLLDLVESGWRDLMVLTHVKEGSDSQAWADHIKTLDLLTAWLSEQQQGGLNEDLLMQRGLEAETVIDMMDQQISAALPTNIAHENVLHELREILASNRDVESAQVSEYGRDQEVDAEALRAKVEDLPRLRRWVRRVEQLEKGSWLSYRDKDDQKRRMQLAWINDAKDRFIFVSERGQKVADLNAVQLARKLSRGAQPPAPTDKLSVVDQTMYQTLEHVQKTLSFARNHDTLTKLINRETFLVQVARTLRHAQLKNSQHAILYLNIDKFALVNDVYDPVSGDQVLLEFSKLLAQLHGKKYSSARIEGDEFAVLVLDRTPEQALSLAEKIRSDIAGSSMDIEGEKVSFTVSVGVVPIAEYSPSVEELLESSRTAMRHAKELGRNRVQLYEEDKTLAGTFSTDKKKTRENLEQALATDRFMLRAQPIVQTAIDGDNRSSRHYELLLALRDKDGNISSPEDFIHSAERYGFMTLVDRWVVREAFAWISELMDDQKEVPSLAINLSGSSVTNDEFMEYLFEQISEFGVGTSLICFEITETGTISNLVKAADFVRAFRNIGCKFSLDDFGTGLASHNYLRELPVDYVKIDGTFVTNIHESRADYAMARSINDLAHFLGQETIAESVENDQIVEKLREIGVDYLQGWGVGKPKPLTDITEDLSNIVR